VIDITIAFVTFIFSVIMLGDIYWLGSIGGISGILALLLYAGAKKLLTVPRIGYVKFPQQRAQRITAVAIALGVLSFVAGTVALIQTIGQGTPDWLLLLIENYMLTIGTTVAALFLLAGYAFKTKRIYAYALLTLVMFFAVHFIYFPLYYYLTALGSLILACGLFMMIRFVRKYPKATETVDA
jgi:predicted neutral ceramidase superfamily lipid hydrolase